MILVTFAVPFESADFRRREISRRVRVLHTGVGQDAARVALETAFCESLPELVVASGFAGALNPDFRIGEIVCEGADIAGTTPGRFATSDTVLATTEARRLFREETGADAVEMEGQGIRQVCEAAGVPFLTFRAISDCGDIGFPPEELERLASQPLRYAMPFGISLLRNTARRRAFLQFLRDCRQAQRALGEGLSCLISKLQEA